MNVELLFSSDQFPLMTSNCWRKSNANAIKHRTHWNVFRIRPSVALCYSKLPCLQSENGEPDFSRGTQLLLQTRSVTCVLKWFLRCYRSDVLIILQVANFASSVALFRRNCTCMTSVITVSWCCVYVSPVSSVHNSDYEWATWSFVLEMSTRPKSLLSRKIHYFA